MQVMSQVLVPPLVEAYRAVKDEWMLQKLWETEPFVEVLDPDCAPDTSASVVQAVHRFLEL